MRQQEILLVFKAFILTNVITILFVGVSSGSSQDYPDGSCLDQAGQQARNVQHRVSLELSQQYTELARKLSEVEGIQAAPPSQATLIAAPSFNPVLQQSQQLPDMHFYQDGTAVVGTPQDASSVQKCSIDEGVCDNGSDENKDVHFDSQDDGASANKLFLRGVSVDTSCPENVHITQEGNICPKVEVQLTCIFMVYVSF